MQRNKKRVYLSDALDEVSKYAKRKIDERIKKLDEQIDSAFTAGVMRLVAAALGLQYRDYEGFSVDRWNREEGEIYSAIKERVAKDLPPLVEKKWKTILKSQKLDHAIADMDDEFKETYASLLQEKVVELLTAKAAADAEKIVSKLKVEEVCIDDRNDDE